VAAALAALRILRAEPDRPVRLRAAVSSFLGMLAERGVPTNPAESAIVTIPLRKDSEVDTVLLALDLLDHGVFVNPVIPPAVTKEMGLIRLSLMVDHDTDLLEEAADTLSKVMADHDQL
jgi:8-amino-7-oxononanoate synthase